MADEQDWADLHTQLQDALTSPEAMDKHPDLPTQTGSAGNFLGDPSIGQYAGDAAAAYSTAMSKAGAPETIVRMGAEQVRGLATQKARQFAVDAFSRGESAPPAEVEYAPFSGRILSSLLSREPTESQARIQAGQGSYIDYSSVGQYQSRQKQLAERGTFRRMADTALGFGQFAGEAYLTGAGALGGLAEGAALRVGAGGLAARAAGTLGTSAGLTALQGGTTALTGGFQNKSADDIIKDLADDFAGNAAFVGIGQLGREPASRVGGYVVRTLRLLAAGELTQDLRQLVGRSPQAGPLGEIAAGAATGDKERRDRGLKDFMAQGGAALLFEGAMSAARRGEKPTEERILQDPKVQQVLAGQGEVHGPPPPPDPWARYSDEDLATAASHVGLSVKGPAKNRRAATIQALEGLGIRPDMAEEAPESAPAGPAAEPGPGAAQAPEPAPSEAQEPAVATPDRTAPPERTGPVGQEMAATDSDGPQTGPGAGPAAPRRAASEAQESPESVEPTPQPESPPLSRLEKMRARQSILRAESKPGSSTPTMKGFAPGTVEAPRTRFIPERTRFIPEAMRRASDQAALLRAFREQHADETPPGIPAPENREAKASKDWRERALGYRLPRYRARLRGAIADPTPENISLVASDLEHLARNAVSRGLDPATLADEQLPELRAFAEKVLSNPGLLAPNAEESHALEIIDSLAQHHAIEPASVRRGVASALSGENPETGSLPSAERSGEAPAAHADAEAAGAESETASHQLSPAEKGRSSKIEPDPDMADLWKEADKEGIPRASMHEYYIEGRKVDADAAVEHNANYRRALAGIAWGLRRKKGGRAATGEPSAGELSAARRLINGAEEGDALKIRALDEVAEEPGIAQWIELHREPGEPNATDTLYRLLQEGPSRPRSMEELYSEALDYFGRPKEESRVQPEEAQAANLQLRRGGEKPLTADDLARVEAEGRTEGAASEDTEPPAAPKPEEAEAPEEPAVWEPDLDIPFGNDDAGSRPGLGRRIGERVRDFADRLERDAERELKDKTQGFLFSGFDPTLIPPLSKMVAAKILKGGYTLADWTAQAVERFGEAIKAHVKDVWDKALEEAAKVRRSGTTSISNETVDQERSARGLPPMMAALKKTYAEVWDRVMERIGRDPEAPAKLVQELKKDPRPVSDFEDLTLLHERVRLSNEHAVAVERLRLARQGGDAFDVRDAESHERGLSDRLSELEDVTRRAGTETARGLAFRRALAREDYSLAPMLARAKAAKGTALTPGEELQVKVLSARIGQVQDAQGAAEAKLTPGDGAATPAEKPQVIRQWREALGEGNRLKARVRDLEGSLRKQSQTVAEQLPDWLTRMRRAWVLSSPSTLLKVGAAGVERLAITPAEEAVGTALRQVPFLKRIAEMAPRQGAGLNALAEKKAFQSAFVEGLQDSWKTLRQEPTALETEFGSVRPKGDWKEFAGALHGAEKAPVKRAEFTRSYEQRSDKLLAEGQDPTTPANMLRIGAAAYADAERAIFQGDNRVVSAWKAGLAKLRQPGASAGSLATARAMELTVPILRVPTNLVAETFENAFGLVTGSVRAAQALRSGIQNLKPQQADLIMRQLKKGSLGAAVLALGVMNPDMIGGYYQTGEKRKEGEPRFGSVKIGDWNISSLLLHNPLLEVLQLGATFRRVWDRNVGRQGEGESAVRAAVSAVGGMLEEVPMMREPAELAKLANPKEQGRALGEVAKSFVVPQGFSWLAGKLDTDQQGNPIRRQPRNILESVQSGVPILREQVPRSIHR